MRLLLLLLLLIGLPGTMKSYAQTVTLKRKNASLQQILLDIYGQTKYYFYGNADIIKNSKKVTIDVKSVPLKTALDICFRGQPVQYSLKDKIILVTPRKSLPAEQPPPIIAEISDTSIRELDRVQIIGYGTITRRYNTGNVSSISAKTLSLQNVTNPLHALQGRVPGVFITQANGLPGSAVNVQIRGRNSIAGSNNPFYIVDEVPFTSTPLQVIGGPNGDGASNYGSPMNLINPSDIQSVEILKDADATAIYGSRAANGVILITTRQPTNNKLTISADLNKSFGRVTRMEPMLQTKRYLQVRREALLNSGMPVNAMTAPDLVLWDTTRFTDWQDWYMGRTTETSTANLSLATGNDQNKVLISGSYHEESTVLPEQTKYRRANMHLSYSYQSKNKRFSFLTNNFFVEDRNRLSGTVQGALSQIITASPNYPVYDSNGNYYWIEGQDNQVAAMRSYYRSKARNLNMNGILKYSITENLRAKLSFGLNSLRIDEVRPNPSYTTNPFPFPRKGSSVFGDQDLNTFVVEPQLEYSFKVNTTKFELLAGSTLQQSSTNSYYTLAMNYESDHDLERIEKGGFYIQDSTLLDYKYLSAFARLRVNYKNRYLFNANLRRDGSSRFGPGRQFGNFYSISAGWLFSEESFIKNNIHFLSFGKLRASYGTVGNDGIADYGFLSLYSASIPYGSTTAISPEQAANDEYRWEQTRKFEVAVEAGFLNDRIYFSLASYHNKTTDQLIQYQLPSMAGLTSYQANWPAVVINRGWEFELTSFNINRPGFKWKTHFNMTFPKNVLQAFPNIENSAYANQLVVGHSLNNVQAYQVKDFDYSTGEMHFLDIGNDGIRPGFSAYNGQNGDRVIVGNNLPKWYSGLANDFTFGKLELSVLLNYVRQEGYNLYRFYGNLGTMRNGFEETDHYWTPANPDIAFPPPVPSRVPTSSPSRLSESNLAFGNSSYLRVRSIAASYDFAKKDARNMMVYLKVQNPFTITRYRSYDPETSGNAILMIPPLKTITLGCRIIF